MSRNQVFHRVGGLRPRRNMFDLSYNKALTCKFGQLIPVLCDEAVPGDVWTIGNELFIRLQPMVHPVMHEITATVHYFFVPTRIIDDNWEQFINKQDNTEYQIPRVTYSDKSRITRGSLWDYFGLPLRTTINDSTQQPSLMPIIYPWWCYNRIYNEYYRDENLQSEDSTDGVLLYPRYRNWTKDYFTSALKDRVKGQAPALPVNISLTSSSDLANAAAELKWFDTNYPNLASSQSVAPFYLDQTSGVILPGHPGTTSGNLPPNSARTILAVPNGNQPAASYNRFGTRYSDIAAAISANATTFNISDLRLATQLQKWLERNSRAGSERYTTFLASHFGVSPSDSRLDRPEYIGGTKQPVIISEVLQTAETSTSPQGNMSGHGISARQGYAGKYRVEEYGYIMGLLSVMPKPQYQNGINRQWLRRLPIDFYFPEFAHLSEQGIYRTEIYSTFGALDSDADPVGDLGIFGYQGQYDEMRVKHDMVCADFRKVPGSNDLALSPWVIARAFDDTSIPMLNSQFITCNPDLSNNFLVSDVDPILVNIRNNLRVARPMPLIAEPGLMDHF